MRVHLRYIGRARIEAERVTAPAHPGQPSDIIAHARPGDLITHHAFPSGTLVVMGRAIDLDADTVTLLLDLPPDSQTTPGPAAPVVPIRG